MGSDYADDDCVFSQRSMTVDDLNGNICIGLFKNNEVSDYIIFKDVSCQCWCGCIEKNCVYIKVTRKKFYFGIEKLAKADSLCSVCEHKNDSNSDSE